MEFFKKSWKKSWKVMEFWQFISVWTLDKERFLNFWNWQLNPWSWKIWKGPAKSHEKSWNLRSSKEYKPCLWVATSGKNFSNDPNKMLKPFHANFKLAKSFQSMSLSESDLHGELGGAVEKWHVYISWSLSHIAITKIQHWNNNLVELNRTEVQQSSS